MPPNCLAVSAVILGKSLPLSLSFLICKMGWSAGSSQKATRAQWVLYQC